ncbi:MAG: uroporphyrinogen decarboxylase/cobalamine-independent methonine synthase family protein [Thermoplasmatota archaeon]
MPTRRTTRPGKKAKNAKRAAPPKPAAKKATKVVAKAPPKSLVAAKVAARLGSKLIAPKGALRDVAPNVAPAAPAAKRVFLTHEIGSIAKPNWRVKAVGDGPLSKIDVADALDWGQRLKVERVDELVRLLEKTNRSPADKETIREISSLYAIRFFESAGLDIVYDGEQRRTEMYEGAANHVEGLTYHGHVRSFDNKYYRKASLVAAPRLKEPYHIEETKYALGVAKAAVKVPITGPYTLMDWSFDEYYEGRVTTLGSAAAREHRKDARRDFVRAVAKDVIRPEIEALVAAGARWIQIDEPAAATKPDEADLVVESFNLATQGIPTHGPRGVKFGLHICFSDYETLFPALAELKNCHEYTWEFANRDATALGTTREKRAGYHVLDLFNEYGVKGTIGLGVVDVHVDTIESPELVRDRILYAAKVLGSPERVLATPDCGLRTRSWDVAYAKLRAVVEGARLAEKEL